MTIENEMAPPDPLHRFTPTPFVADLPVMGREVRLETNSATVLGLARQIFDRYGKSCSGHPQFRWRIVSEPAAPCKPLWRELAAFSDRGLRFVNIGPRSFLAVDLDSREAVGFLPEDLVEDDIAFSTVFLGDLFYMTAGALRLTPIAAACLALGNRGLLLLGPPNSGKTSSCYLAGKLGLEFHADQATFVEISDGSLRAWGDFWPTAFRAEAAQFLPELVNLTRPFQHHDFAFRCMARPSRPGAEARSIVPVSCIFLERGAAELARLIPLSSREFSERLKGSVAFKDDERFEPERSEVFRAFSELPASRLLYGKDPAVTVPFFRSILHIHNLVETLA